MNLENEAIIYGVKTGDTYHYIGKTIKDVNIKGTVNKSNVARQYANPKIKKVFNENNTDVVTLKKVQLEDWYDEKLNEVVQKYGENHPLLNAQWMLDGKHGFWENTDGYWKDKKRDAYTLKRLSESKFKKVVEYDFEGKLVKIWDSGKEIGIKVFKDYRISKGYGKTKLYTVFRAHTLKGRFRFNSYWFREKELIEYFKGIPIKLNFKAMLEVEHKKRVDDRIKGSIRRNINGQKRYTVIQYNIDDSIKNIYKNTSHAAYELKTSIKNVQMLCRGELEVENCILKYGEKILQPFNITYPKYKYKVLLKPKKISNAKKYIRTRTRFSVIEYKGSEIINKFNSVAEAADYYGLMESTVRHICKGWMYKNLNLKFGEKITVNI